MSEKDPECIIGSNIRQNKGSVISSMNACMSVFFIHRRANAISVVHATSFNSRQGSKSGNAYISIIWSGKSTFFFLKGKRSDRYRDDTDKLSVKKVSHKTIDFVMYPEWHFVFRAELLFAEEH